MTFCKMLEIKLTTLTKDSSYRNKYTAEPELSSNSYMHTREKFWIQETHWKLNFWKLKKLSQYGHLQRIVSLESRFHNLQTFETQNSERSVPLAPPSLVSCKEAFLVPTMYIHPARLADRSCVGERDLKMVHDVDKPILCNKEEFFSLSLFWPQQRVGSLACHLKIWTVCWGTQSCTFWKRFCSPRIPVTLSFISPFKHHPERCSSSLFFCSLFFGYRSPPVEEQGLAQP